MTDLNTEGSLLELAESAVRRAFGHFDKPDDDWAATLMYLTPRRDKCIVDLSMRGPDKDATSARMERTLAGMHAVDAVFVASSWITEIEGARPSQAPDRREAITMHHFTRDSAEAFYADIDRFDDRPPRLGRFTLMATDLGVDGRFADAMRRGIGVNDSGEDPEAALAAADAAFAARQAFEARRDEFNAKYTVLKSHRYMLCPCGHHGGPAAAALNDAIDARSVYEPETGKTVLVTVDLPAADVDLLIELCDRLAIVKGKRWNAQFELRAAKERNQ